MGLITKKNWYRKGCNLQKRKRSWIWFHHRSNFINFESSIRKNPTQQFIFPTPIVVWSFSYQTNIIEISNSNEIKPYLIWMHAAKITRLSNPWYSSTSFNNTPVDILPLESFEHFWTFIDPPTQWHLSTQLDTPWLTYTRLLFKDLGLKQCRKSENTVEKKNYNGQTHTLTLLWQVLRSENIFDKWLKYLIFLSWNSDTYWFEKPNFTIFVRMFQYRSSDIV